MESVFTEISNMELDDIQTADYTNFVSMINIAKAAKEANELEDFLSEPERTNLQTIVEADKPITAALALSVLKRDNPDLVFNEEVYDIEQNSARKGRPETGQLSSANSTKDEFRLYPNPALDYTTLQYNCQFNNLTYSVIDISGREVKTGFLKTIENTKANEVLINLGGISPGTYYFVVKTNDTSLFTEKLVIAK